MLYAHRGKIVYLMHKETIRIQNFLQIALALSGTHQLEGENTVVLCIGLRKTRIKLKENKVAKWRSQGSNWFM